MKKEIINIYSDNKIKTNEICDFCISEKEVNSSFFIESNKSLLINLIDIDNINSSINIIFNLKNKSKLLLNIISLSSTNNKKEYHLSINHNHPESYSRVNISGINLGGNILVDAKASIIQGANKSDTRIEGKITNLSSVARSRISPILYIKENDVKASHSASLGSYNEADLFYLTSRGLTLGDAKKAITYGSIYPLINNINDTRIKTLSLDKIRSLSLC